MSDIKTAENSHDPSVINPDDLKVINSLSSLVQSIYGDNGMGFPASGGKQVSQTDTLFLNNRWYLISNFRQLLSQMYVEHGIVQTLIDQPVDDAFRAGFEIKTEQFDGDDIERLMNYLERNNVIRTIMQAHKWARLFGGAAVVVLTDEDPATPFNPSSINENSPLGFRAVDMWELYDQYAGLEDDQLNASEGGVQHEPEFYDFHGKKVHNSRVYRVEGKEAPSFIRPRLRGWGMSEIERLVRSLNQYMKNQDVVFDLLDEAKVDVYKIKSFNSSLATANGTNKLSERIQLANMLKGHNHALTMDSEDDYQQKQVAFTGLSEVLVQIRQGIAADLKMPLTKLFGLSASGFNSGEDDIENYNSMVESEVRAKCKYNVVDILQLCCQKMFGTMADDMAIEFAPLRMLSAKEEEEVKNHQFNRVVASYTSGLILDSEAKESINVGSLLPVEIDEGVPAGDPIDAGEDYSVDEGSQS